MFDVSLSDENLLIPDVSPEWACQTKAVTRKIIDNFTFEEGATEQSSGHGRMRMNSVQWKSFFFGSGNLRRVIPASSRLERFAESKSDRKNVARAENRLHIHVNPVFHSSVQNESLFKLRHRTRNHHVRGQNVSNGKSPALPSPDDYS